MYSNREAFLKATVNLFTDSRTSLVMLTCHYSEVVDVPYVNTTYQIMPGEINWRAEAKSRWDRERDGYRSKHQLQELAWLVG